MYVNIYFVNWMAFCSGINGLTNHRSLDHPGMLYTEAFMLLYNTSGGDFHRHDLSHHDAAARSYLHISRVSPAMNHMRGSPLNGSPADDAPFVAFVDTTLSPTCKVLLMGIP